MYMDIYRALSTAACGLCLGRGGAGPAAGGGVGGPEACLAAGGGPGSLPPIPQSSAPCPRRPQGSPDTGRGGAVPAAPPGPFRACCGRGRDGASWTGHGVGHREAGAGLRRGSPRGEWAGSGLGAPSNGEGRKVSPDRAGEVPVVVVVPPLASASPGGTGSRPPPSCLELSAGSGTPLAVPVPQTAEGSRRARAAARLAVLTLPVVLCRRTMRPGAATCSGGEMGAPGAKGYWAVIPSRSRPSCPRQSFALVRGAALLLPAEEPPASGPSPAVPPGRQERHLQLMMQLLRSQDAIQLVGSPPRWCGVGDGDETGWGMGWGWDGDGGRDRGSVEGGCRWEYKWDGDGKRDRMG